MEFRDWLMLGLGLGAGFLIFTTVGKRAVMAGIGVGKAETERLLSKIERKAEKRKILD